MKGSASEKVLVADIGGTNARFALTDLECGERPKLYNEQRFSADRFASLQHAARHYLSSVSDRGDIKRAAIAVACPVIGDEIRLINRSWSFSRRELKAELALDELLVMNDFGATARSIPALHADEKVILHHGIHHGPRAPISVIGPGTGMGVALITQLEPDNWHVIETEGGHVSYAPQGSEEQMIHGWLSERHGRVSIERVLSGKGLAWIHAALSDRHPSRTQTPSESLVQPADIVARALAGEDVACRRALARFCAILGSFAGDCALIHGARTVAIAGGIVPRYASFLRASAFVERFLDKGRFAAWLEAVRVVLVTHPEPGLLGAALALQDARRPETVS